jgi:hypothetical protein
MPPIESDHSDPDPPDHSDTADPGEAEMDWWKFLTLTVRFNRPRQFYTNARRALRCKSTASMIEQIPTAALRRYAKDAIEY